MIIAALADDGRVLAGPGRSRLAAGGLPLDLRLPVRQRCGRAFLQPAKSALLPLLVSRSRFANAVTWSTSGFQLASIVGPALGRVADRRGRGGGAVVYLLDAGLVAGVRRPSAAGFAPRPPAAEPERLGLRSLLAGAAFVWRTKLILGAISLDMFAVLLGGATALLPVYAKDILQAGPDGLGWLRGPGAGGPADVVSPDAPPAVAAGRGGPVVVGDRLWRGHRSCSAWPARSGWPGRCCSWPGPATWSAWSIRHTLIQLWTPDAMRGRVSAVNGMFIGISNELGEFESGTVAHWFERPGDPAFGPTLSVVSGGLGTILVVLLAAWLFPAVRRHGRLDEGPENKTGRR